MFETHFIIWLFIYYFIRTYSTVIQNKIKMKKMKMKKNKNEKNKNVQWIHKPLDTQTHTAKQYNIVKCNCVDENYVSEFSNQCSVQWFFSYKIWRKNVEGHVLPLKSASVNYYFLKPHIFTHRHDHHPLSNLLFDSVFISVSRRRFGSFLCSQDWDALVSHLTG